MDVTRERIAGVMTIQLRSFHDERGFFVERFNAADFRASDIPVEFCQDNHSRSKPGVVRGLHYQTDPAQGKLVGVIRGRIWDVVVDIRPDSPTFGQHLYLELSDDNGKLIWMPPGVAHGFCVLGEEPADVLYKVDRPYNRHSEGGIVWNDAELDIEWPVTAPIVSERDRELPTFAQYRQNQPHWSNNRSHV